MSGSLPVFTPQQAPNPFAQAGQTINTINALQDYRAKQATADAYGQSIDPQTGTFDQGKFNALMAGTPQGRWNIGPSMQQSGQAMSAEGQGQQQQVQAKMQQLQGISGYMSPLFQKTLQGQPVSGQDVLDATNQAVNAGVATPAMAANIQKQVASLGPNGDATNLVRGAYFATGSGMQQLQAQMPNYQPLNTGPVTVYPQMNPLAPNAVSGNTAVPMGMSPAQWNAPTDIQIGGGQTIQVPFGMAGPMLANNPNLKKLNPNLGGGSGGGQITNQSFGPNGGRYSPPATPTTPPGTPTAQPSASGPYVIGDSVGQGIRNAGKYDGTTMVGASPQTVLGWINDPKNALPVQGRDVVLANGSNPGNLATIPDQITALQKQGVRSITVVGVADPRVDAQLQQYAEAAGVRYQPMGAAGSDGVHPQDYGGLSKAVMPQAAPAAKSTPSWAQPPPPPVQGGAAGGIGVTAAPGYAETQRDTAVASGRAYTALQAQVNASKDIEPILADMDAQSRTAGFSTGIGSTIAGTVRQLAQRAGLVPEGPSGNLDLSSPQAAQEEFAKDAARLQAAQLGSLGNPTDARQELSETTNPGLMLSKYGNQGIIHMLQGNQQAIRAMGDAWGQAAQNGWTPDRFNEWMSQRFLATDQATGGRFDPRAFWLANMPTLAEQQAYVKKVPPAQAAQLRKNMQYAISNGWATMGSDGSVRMASQ
jgi:hypothetical protein